MFDIREPINRLIVSEWSTHKPEVVSVLVAGTDLEDVAREVAPILARDYWPELTLGETLHLEQTPEGWIVDVEVR